MFTGKLSSLGRKDARALVIRLGGATADDVNAKTTMLVIGAEGFGPTPNADEATPAVSVVSGFSRTVRDKSNKIKRAEELILTLPGVISARIIAGDSGAIDQIHVLTTSELTPKRTL